MAEQTLIKIDIKRYDPYGRTDARVVRKILLSPQPSRTWKLWTVKTGQWSGPEVTYHQELADALQAVAQYAQEAK